MGFSGRILSYLTDPVAQCYRTPKSAFWTCKATRQWEGDLMKHGHGCWKTLEGGLPWDQQEIKSDQD